MSNNKIIESGKQTMQKAVEHLKSELTSVRTGRASSGLVENLMVDSYGSKTPLKSVASISIPESNQIVIQAWDRNMLGNIEKAIQESNLGLNPVNDGNVIRIVLSPPTEEKRKELVKVIHKFAEDGKIAVRNARQEAHTHLKQAEKDGEMTEDDIFQYEKELQKVVDDFNDTIDEVAKNKEQEVMSL